MSLRSSASSSARQTLLRSRRLRRVTLTVIFEGLTRELDQLAPVYERIRPEALSVHPTLAGLLGRLAQKEPGDTSALLCAVLIAHQETPHRLWGAILLQTFRPMVRHVFKKLLGADRDERMTLLLNSFQEAIRRVDPHKDPVRIAMYIRQATRRLVFAALRHQREWEEIGFGVSPDKTPDPQVEVRAVAADRVAEMPDLALLHVGRERGALWEWVQHEVPGAETEQLRVYHRLRRRRQRLVLTLRDPNVTSQKVQ